MFTRAVTFINMASWPKTGDYVDNQEVLPIPQVVEVPLTKEERAEAFALYQVQRTHPSYGAVKLGFIGGYESREADITELVQKWAGVVQDNNIEISALKSDFQDAMQLLDEAKGWLHVYSGVNSGFSWRRLWNALKGSDNGAVARIMVEKIGSKVIQIDSVIGMKHEG